MQKIKYIITTFIICLLINGCGNDKANAINDYQKQLESFYNSINETCSSMDQINIDDANSIDAFLNYMDIIKSDIVAIGGLTVPSEYKDITIITDQAITYIDTANSLYHEIYSNNSFENYDSEKAINALNNYNNAISKLNEMGEFIKSKSLEISSK